MEWIGIVINFKVIIGEKQGRFLVIMAILMHRQAFDFLSCRADFLPGTDKPGPPLMRTAIPVRQDLHGESDEKLCGGLPADQAASFPESSSAFSLR